MDKNVIEISNDVEHAKNALKGLVERVAIAFKSCNKAGLLNSQDCFDLGALVGMINRLETAAYKASKDLDNFMPPACNAALPMITRVVDLEE